MAFTSPAPAATAAIATHALTKRYGSTLALDGLDLTVAPGEVYGFLGPNGAGKTTTVRLLLGLHRPTSGRAELFGLDSWAQPVHAHQRVSYVPGEPAGQECERQDPERQLDRAAPGSSRHRGRLTTDRRAPQRK
jgi:ABC-type Mn2+/Zn2+ transport system ATPase subunit